VAVVQTAGDLANWHPHVHALVSRGGWTRDWKWVPLAYVDEHAAELLYRHKVMRMLQEEGLLTEERTELLNPAEFLARVIMHVPEPRRHLVRYYGTYSNVSRGKRRRQDEADIGAAPRDIEHATLGPARK
ncbi:hypothetical protein LCGC14_2945930, partial [marine sediment metagenome]